MRDLVAGMTESRGTLNIVFPSVVSSALLRKMRSELVYERAQGPAVHQESIGERLLPSKVAVELSTPAIPVRIPELLALRPGAVLNLRCRVEQPALLTIKERACWSARPVGSGNCRAAQMLVEIPPEQESQSL